MSAIRTIIIGGNFTKAQLTANPFNGTSGPLILKTGQLAIEKDTGEGKRGDGTTNYSTLPYLFTSVHARPVAVTVTNSSTITVSVPAGYSKYYVNAWVNNQVDQSRIMLIAGNDAQINIISNGDPVTYLFY